MGLLQAEHERPGSLRGNQHGRCFYDANPGFADGGASGEYRGWNLIAGELLDFPASDSYLLRGDQGLRDQVGCLARLGQGA